MCTGARAGTQGGPGGRCLRTAPHPGPKVGSARHAVSWALPTHPRTFASVSGVNTPTPNKADLKQLAVAMVTVAREPSQRGQGSGTGLPRTSPRGEDLQGPDCVQTAGQARTRTHACSDGALLPRLRHVFAIACGRVPPTATDPGERDRPAQSLKRLLWSMRDGRTS